MAPHTYLDDILVAHRRRVAADQRDLDALVTAASLAPTPRGFRSAVVDSARHGLAVVAEIKRRSPSKGALDLGLDPAQLAGQYQAGGAACLSVLTDGDFFGGSPADLASARSACSLPVLRKDFTISAADVCDARLMGADAVLLIAAALDDRALAALSGCAVELGLDALVEVHDQRELDRALALGAGLVGVNQRDLTTFEVDEHRAVSLADHIPNDVVAVAESGVRQAEDATRLAAAGYQAVLVGEALVRSADRQGAVSSLRGAPIGVRGTATPGVTRR